MKRVVLVLLMVLVANADGYLNEPKEFRGIPWGASLSGIDGMKKTEPVSLTYVPDSMIDCYIRSEDKMSISGVPLTSIKYCEHNNQFFYVQIKFEKLSEYRMLFHKLSSIYGFKNIYRQRDNIIFGPEASWVGKKVNIFMEYNYKGKRAGGYITYKYAPMFKILAKDIKNQEKQKAKQKALEARQKIGNDL